MDNQGAVSRSAPVSTRLETEDFVAFSDSSAECSKNTVYFSIAALFPAIRPNTTQASVPLPPGRLRP